jgi:hypothetical protein
MGRLAKMRLFQKTATGVLFIFMGLMVLVTIKAYTRTSGVIRQDFSQSQFIRKEALLQKKQAAAEAQATFTQEP